MDGTVQSFCHGEFVVEEVLHDGVLLCRQKPLGNRHVVVHINEERSTTEVTHPNICPVLTSKTDNETNRHLNVEAFVGRRTLAELLERLSCCQTYESFVQLASEPMCETDELHEPFTSALAAPTQASFDLPIWIARQLTDALATAHEKGVRHGQLTAGNCWITADGRPAVRGFTGLGSEAGDLYDLGQILRSLLGSQSRRAVRDILFKCERAGTQAGFEHVSELAHALDRIRPEFVQRWGFWQLTIATMVVVFAILFIGIIYPSWRRAENERAFDKGKQSLINKDYDQAIHWFDEVIEESPQSASAVFLLGLTKYQAGDFAGARLEFDRAQRLQPHGRNLAMLGQVSIRLGKPDVEYFLAALQSGYRSDALLMQCARFAPQQQDLQPFLALNDEVLSNHPQSEYALVTELKIDAMAYARTGAFPRRGLRAANKLKILKVYDSGETLRALASFYRTIASEHPEFADDAVWCLEKLARLDRALDRVPAKPDISHDLDVVAFQL